MEKIAQLILENLKKCLQIPVQFEDLEIPSHPQWGDFSFPCFKLSKIYKKSPQEIAKALSSQLNRQISSEFQIQSIGPYLNWKISPYFLSSQILSAIFENSSKEKGYGQLPPHSQQTWVLEYSSPNIAKPLNIYHLRSIAIGAALDRISRYRGHHVISINHLGDWGKQYGLLAIALIDANKNENDSLTITDLEELYVNISKRAQADQNIQKRAQEAFLKLEQGDPLISNLWKKCVHLSIQEFQKIYQRLGVNFDYILGESHYQSHLMPLLEDLKKRNILIKSQGAWIVPVEDEKGNPLPPCLLQKSDGASLYATRDLAAALDRYKKFQFDQMNYIVGHEQKLHFQQIFGVLRKLNLPWANRCQHIPFGLYHFKDEKMSTRKGNAISLEKVLTGVKLKIQAKIKDRFPDIKSEDLEETSEKIALGALIFQDLHTDPMKDVEFDLEKMTAFEGHTGPYLQYAHTRCLSLLKKAIQKGYQKPSYSPQWIPNFNQEAEILLIKNLGYFPIYLQRALHFHQPSQLCHYLIQLAKTFNTFYRNCPVLDADPSQTQSRLLLIEGTRKILAQGLKLLGIPLPERM